MIVTSQNFTFNYTAYDQNASLFVAFQVYNVTSGSAVFVQQVVGVYTANGCYVGNFAAALGQTYLIIGAVYTSNSYAIVDSTRAPTGDIYQVVGPSVTNLFFAYPAFDLSTSLNVQATIYDTTSSIPVAVANVVMSHVVLGVYFGHYFGTVGRTYDSVSVVYTNNTYTTPNFIYAPGSDSFAAFNIQPYQAVLGRATLIGQTLAAVLVGE